MSALLDIARGVLADRRRLHSISADQIVALCEALVETDSRAQLPTPLAEAATALFDSPDQPGGPEFGARLAHFQRLYTEEFCP